MKKIISIIIICILIFTFSVFIKIGSKTKDKIQKEMDIMSKQNSTSNITESKDVKNKDKENTNGEKNMKIKITVNNHELYAKLEDNATTKMLVKQMPFTIHMNNLYGREMCYHYGANTFPIDALRSDGYEIGDIVYWPPRGSLVILYSQNGERFERQQIGHIESGVEIFKNIDNADVTFDFVN